MASLVGMLFQLFFNTKICQMVNASKMGGKMMLTNVFGIRMIRKQITIIDMRMKGAYALAPSLISSPFKRIINDI